MLGGRPNLFIMETMEREDIMERVRNIEVEALKRLKKNVQENRQQITDPGEAPRYLRALTAVIRCAVDRNTDSININDALGSVFELMMYYQAVLELKGAEANKKHKCSE